jgi:arylsulfatase A-like enzyme
MEQNLEGHRRASRLGVLAAGALAAASVARAQATETGGAPERPPNVVLILADDLGSECLGSYGGESYATPQLDALAADGVRFTHFFSQPLCTPSRVKLLTGRSNVRNYVRFSILDPDERTIAHVLSGAGYATGAVGKWQLLGAEHYEEHAGTGATPDAAGFDEWCLWQVGRLGSRYADPLLDIFGGESAIGAEPAPGEERPALEGRYGPNVFAEWADAFISRHADESFFLYYPMALVHAPFVPTPANPARDAGDRAGCFADMVGYMDAVVGRIVASLERAGVADDTLILFLGDNGTDRRITSLANGREVRGGKRATTDTGTRVPLIARWPGRVSAGVVADDLVDLSDVLPTVCELAGIALPPEPELDGVSFAPRLLGRPFEGREWVFEYHDPRPGNPSFPPVRFVRGRRYKLYDSGELFDLVADPDERSPLAEGASEEARAARASLAAVLASFPERSPRLKPD